MSEKKSLVVVTDIGEYVDQHCCERSFKLRLDKSEIARRFPFYGRVRGPLNPILAVRGREREEELGRSLGTRVRLLNPCPPEGECRISWQSFLESVRGTAPGSEVFAREVEIEGEVGDFVLSGRMDFLVLRWRDGVPVLRIVECKASRRDKTYHRIQLAAYRTMVGDHLERHGLEVGGARYDNVVLESVVARIDPDSNQVQDALGLPSLDLVEEMGDLRNLLSDKGTLARIARTDLEDLSYRLDAKCGACVHCPICMPDSARRRRLELLGIDPSEVRMLHQAGIATIDDLAGLDPHGDRAAALRRTIGFSSDLGDLIVRAKARRSNMSGSQQGDFGVMPIGRSGPGLLPAHVGPKGEPLVRVFLDVEYDYIEDRLVGLAAHVTDSELSLLTPYNSDRTPDPELREVSGKEEDGPAMRSQEVVRLIMKAWTGDVGEDDRAERELIGGFFDELVNAIVRAGGSGWRPLHFYTWSQGDMGHLIDACYRCGGPLLHHLTELLGCRAECRADLEQTIYTPLMDEVRQKVTVGYTGLSPVIATSVRWFGSTRFHWTRMVSGRATDLSYVMRRDIFDFRTALAMDPEGEWCDRDAPGAQSGFFEVRTYFSSDVNAPYWYAMWGALPQKVGKDNMLPRALEDYRRGGSAPTISAFLLAKCQALRWIEERLYKNYHIEKPPIPLGELRHIGTYFTSRYDIVEASLDFLRLDHHVKRAAWLIDSLRAPSARVADGSALPLRGLFKFEEEGQEHVAGEVDLDRFRLDSQAYFASCTLDVGSFVRLAPYSGDIEESQTIRELLNLGVTATVKVLDRERGAFLASIVKSGRSDGPMGRYLLPSYGKGLKDGGQALVGESLSNYARARVDAWLSEHGASPIVRWFDPQGPTGPVRERISDATLATLQAALTSMDLDGHRLDEVQLRSCLDGLTCTVQLLLGPPGTGKTNTAAAAVLARLAARTRRKLFLLSANTHTAVDELAARIRDASPRFLQAAARAGLEHRPHKVLRLVGGDTLPNEGEVGTWNDALIREEMGRGDVVLCGTVGELLKVADRFQRSDPMRADGLMIDEASMMVFPDFLALATLLAVDGEIMLVGDHKQLSPITSHDWEEESREQVIALAPHQSCYEAVRRLSERTPPGAIGRSALTVTYRLTPELTHLISGVYAAEGVELRSRKRQESKSRGISSLADIWDEKGVYLVVHDESCSRKSNLFEARLVYDIMAARGVEEHEVPPATVSVITPHRAQRGLLRTVLERDFRYHLKLIDTVERLQGGECETIMVSGTQSDAGAITGSADFILDLNRTNVIFSRARERLIVVCSRSLLDSIPADIDDYASSYLWKHLRSVCDTVVLKVPGYEHEVEIRVPGRFWGHLDRSGRREDHQET